MTDLQRCRLRPHRESSSCRFFKELVSATRGQARPLLEYLFSCGTLQSATVQEANFGRALLTDPDVLTGFHIESITIADPDMIETSGLEQHPILGHSAIAAEAVDGSVLELTSDELRAADAYEVDDHHRIEVTLASGRRAWVYVTHEDQA